MGNQLFGTLKSIFVEVFIFCPYLKRSTIAIRGLFLSHVHHMASVSVLFPACIVMVYKMIIIFTKYIQYSPTQGQEYMSRCIIICVSYTLTVSLIKTIK